MRGVFVLLGEDINKVKAASNMVDSDKVSLDRFTDRIFTDLNMWRPLVDKMDDKSTQAQLSLKIGTAFGMRSDLSWRSSLIWET
eukprot:10336779-Ditylum_brightwellii.AAC.1